MVLSKHSPSPLAPASPSRSGRVSDTRVALMTNLTRLTVLACVSVSAVMLGIAQARAQATMACAPVTREEIVALFDRWNASLATHDPEKVIANYAPDAVLLPTVSNRPRTNSADLRDYFEHFLSRSPEGSIDTRTIRIGCNTASDVGTYTFRLSGKTPDATEAVKARYSFIYELHNGEWLIVHHHSSAMPEQQ